MTDPVVGPGSLDRDQLFLRYARTRHVDDRNLIVESFAPLAEFFAKRYKNRGAEQDDLRQVAQLALVGAVERFDPEMGVQFSTFAGRTIDGELKRYFRDKMWAVRVPRSLKEVSLEVRKTAERISIDLGRAATVLELAEATGYETDEIIEALDVQATGFRADSLQRPAGDGEGRTLADTLAGDNRNVEVLEIQMAVRRLLGGVEGRERQILEMRFFEDKSQQEIADEIGVSQMHVSRLLKKILAELKAQMRQD